jgi:hypothetical protein
MDRCIETFPYARFRDLFGVPPVAYTRGNDFDRFVVLPALLELNGLSDMSADIQGSEALIPCTYNRGDGLMVAQRRGGVSRDAPGAG